MIYALTSDCHESARDDAHRAEHTRVAGERDPRRVMVWLLILAAATV